MFININAVDQNHDYYLKKIEEEKSDDAYKSKPYSIYKDHNVFLDIHSGYQQYNTTRLLKKLLFNMDLNAWLECG